MAKTVTEWVLNQWLPILRVIGLTFAITMDIYCHWIPGEGRDGLEAALSGTSAV